MASQIQDFVRKLTPLQVGLGVLIGFFFSPVIATFFAILVPLTIVLGVLLAAAAAYLVIKLKATKHDFVFLSRAIPARLRQIYAVKKNVLTDGFWYERYDSEKELESPAFINAGDGATHSWRQIEELSNRVAHWALKQKWEAGTTVGLFMLNRAEFVAVWLGLAKVGIRTALLNTNLRKQVLKHSVETGECKAVIYDHELTDALNEIRGDLRLPLFAFDGPQEQANSLGATFLPSVLQEVSALRVPVEFSASARGVKMDDAVLYIYTSGTTGMPKASKITHFRFRMAASSFASLFAVRKDDVLYTPLPLYHSAGGMIGVGAVFSKGCPMVLRKKFTASGFAKDCSSHNVTVIQYIGELARYLVATPKVAEEALLKIRLAIGNGLRPDVWMQFKDRFGIEQVCEFYAATEGASGLLNITNAPFSIGYNSPLIRKLAPSAIVKFDQEKEEVVRGPDGRCILCAPGEPGEFIAKIRREMGVASNYSGYTDKNASDKKVLKDAFVDGDQWFRSGDLLKQDENFNVFFVDRIGDTFRWKGENCATTQVAEVLGSFKGIPEANVYGVEVPHNDGRAGMACVVGVAPATVDFNALAAFLLKELPRYAVPLFLRFSPEIELTSTFKQVKSALRKQGFDPSQVGKDPLFFFDGKTYVPLTDEIYKNLQSGAIRV